MTDLEKDRDDGHEDGRDDGRDDGALMTLFAEARETGAVPSDDLMARILADAAAVDAARHPAPETPGTGFWAGLVAAVGGWPGLGGLAAATVAGLWIGIAPPSGLSGLADAVFGSSSTSVSVSVFSVDDVLGSEG